MGCGVREACCGVRGYWDVADYWEGKRRVGEDWVCALPCIYCWKACSRPSSVAREAGAVLE